MHEQHRQILEVIPVRGALWLLYRMTAGDEIMFDGHEHDPPTWTTVGIGLTETVAGDPILAIFKTLSQLYFMR